MVRTEGDYYIPCPILSAEEERPIGIWGQQHKRYLKEYKNVTYTTLLISGKLNSYFADSCEILYENDIKINENAVSVQAEYGAIEHAVKTGDMEKLKMLLNGLEE